MNVGKIDMNQLRGISDKGVGLAKELAGTLFGNESLQRQGEAQQDRASEEMKAFRKQAEAQAEEAKADTFEQSQKAAQRAKEAS
ncbi:MAG: CsbD family protein [Acidimicrobiales bacterium]